jgi:hypothetical protein
MKRLGGQRALFCWYVNRETKGVPVNGGEGEIRTPGTREGSTVFETAAIDHSATSPRHAQYTRKCLTGRETCDIFNPLVI